MVGLLKSIVLKSIIKFTKLFSSEKHDVDEHAQLIKEWEEFLKKR